MTVAEWWIFLPACIGMNFFPGPNNLLALVHGTQTNGWQATLAGLARLPMMAFMLVLLAVGLEMLLAMSARAFDLLKWVGALYLLWMAYQALIARMGDIGGSVGSLRLPAMMRSEALVAITNPKLILIFYAFFPQFIRPEEPIALQVAVMGGTFILIEVAAIMTYGFGGFWLQSWLKNTENTRWLSRFTALALASAATLILLP